VLLFVVLLLLVRLLLGNTLFSYFLFLSISFYALRLWCRLLSSIIVDSSLSFTRSVRVDSSVTVKRFSRAVVDRLSRSSYSSLGIVVRTLPRLLAFHTGSAFDIYVYNIY
jgi:hypothetical protein